jgi:putative transposase
MIAFVDEHRRVAGVESICHALRVAPSTYYTSKAQLDDSQKRSKRQQRDTTLRDEIQRVWDQNFQVYGVRKVWHQLKREGFRVARCTIARLMRQIGLKGAVRGRTKRTTVSSDKDQKPLDLVQRAFHATRPNQLWVADFTYIATWSGFVYTAFIIDVFARVIVGWRVASSMSADLTLDALEQALWARRVKDKLIHHSDHGGQYIAIRYTDRLDHANIDPSVGSVGDAYDNALAESVIGLYKTELIRKRAPWRTQEAVELATLEWVHWFNTKRLFEPIGNMPPAEYESIYYDEQRAHATLAGLN